MQVAVGRLSSLFLRKQGIKYGKYKSHSLSNDALEMVEVCAMGLIAPAVGSLTIKMMDLLPPPPP